MNILMVPWSSFSYQRDSTVLYSVAQLSSLGTHLTTGPLLLVVLGEGHWSVVSEVCYHGCNVRMALFHSQVIWGLILLQQYTATILIHTQYSGTSLIQPSL